MLIVKELEIILGKDQTIVVIDVREEEEVATGIIERRLKKLYVR